MLPWVTSNVRRSALLAISPLNGTVNKLAQFIHVESIKTSFAIRCDQQERDAILFGQVSQLLNLGIVATVVVVNPGYGSLVGAMGIADNATLNDASFATGN